MGETANQERSDRRLANVLFVSLLGKGKKLTPESGSSLAQEGCWMQQPRASRERACLERSHKEEYARGIKIIMYFVMTEVCR
jgi:hypothetical protein